MKIITDTEEAPETVHEHTSNTAVRITDIDMPFWSLVWFMVKITVATIPAALILVVLSGLFWLALRFLYRVFLGPFPFG